MEPSTNKLGEVRRVNSSKVIMEGQYNDMKLKKNPKLRDLSDEASIFNIDELKKKEEYQS